MKQHIERLGRNTIIYGLGSALPRVVGLLLLPVFTAYLKPEEYGTLALLGVLSMIAQPIFALGISTSMGPLYFETHDQERKCETVWAAFTVMVASAAALALCGWMFPGPLARLVLLPAGHNELVSLTLSSCALGVLATPLMQWLQFDEQAKLFVAISTTAALTVSVASIVLVVYFSLGARGMILGQLVGNVIALIAFLGAAIQRMRPRFSGRIASQLISLGIRMVPSAGLLFILMHGNKPFLQWFRGLEQTGIYSVGFNLGSVVSIVVTAVATAWYSFFMSFMQKPREAEVLFGRIFTYYVFGVGHVILVLFIFAKPLTVAMAHESFWDAYRVVGLVGSAYFFLGLFNLFLPGLYFAKEVSLVTIIQAAAAIISLPLNYVLVVNFGLGGAALAVAASHLLMSILTYAWNRYRAKLYPNIKYEWRRVFTFSAGALVLVAASMGRLWGSLTGDLVQSAALWVLAICLVYFCLNETERQQLAAKLNIITHGANKRLL